MESSMYPSSLMQDDREKIEIFVSGRSLKNMDTFSKSDPQAIMYIKNSKQQWVEYGRTEWITNDNNPNFVKTFQIDYIFEMQQHVMFAVGDVDNNGKNFQSIGSCETAISKLMGSKDQTCILELMDNSKKNRTGKLIIRCEKVGICRESGLFKIRCEKMLDVHTFSKSSPFLTFSRVREDQQTLKVHQTETIQSNLNPIFQSFEIKLQKLCNGDYLRPIKVEAYDFESNGQHKFLGSTTFSIDQITKSNQKKFEFKQKNGKNAGWLIFDSVQLKYKPEFIDFIRGGTQLNLIVAIDFTGSNGVPSQPSSLHYNQVGQLNQYQQAISAVGEILINYDYDRLVPTYGFGGKPKLQHFFTNQTSHCFPINGQPQQPQLYGIDGIMQAYVNILHNIELSGPTLFNPMITEAMKVAQLNKQNNTNVYTILLILTDGVIHDMDQTKTSVCQAAALPLSIIIIGIGNEDFTQMEILDGDDGLIDAHGNKAKRDLVQFVPFNKYKNNPIMLASEVLFELPTQLVEYHQMVGIKPQQAHVVDINAMTGMNQQTENFGQNLIKGNFMQNLLGLGGGGGNQGGLGGLGGLGGANVGDNQQPQNNIGGGGLGGGLGLGGLIKQQMNQQEQILPQQPQIQQQGIMNTQVLPNDMQQAQMNAQYQYPQFTNQTMQMGQNLVQNIMSSQNQNMYGQQSPQNMYNQNMYQQNMYSQQPNFQNNPNPQQFGGSMPVQGGIGYQQGNGMGDVNQNPQGMGLNYNQQVQQFLQQQQQQGQGFNK